MNPWHQAKKKEKAMPIKFSLASGDKKEKKNLGITPKKILFYI